VRPYELISLLQNHKTYIQTHNFPDPDALASAYGLQTFLRYFGIESTLCYDGKIDKLSTKRMLTNFGIEIFAKDELVDMKDTDYIVNVDSQKYNANLTDFIGNEVACIDHHPTYFCCEYVYKDVRIVGACASLVADYFYKTGAPVDSVTAAAICYGIKMDTADFSRGVTDLDVDMFSYMYKKADKKLFSSMYANVMEFKDLKAYGAAIESIQVYDKTGFAYIPFDCPDALIAMISDFILALDVVEFSVVYACRDNGYKFSVRSEDENISAGAVTNIALSEFGSGGGHATMAGGMILKEGISRMGSDVHYKIRNLFLQAIEDIELKADTE